MLSVASAFVLYREILRANDGQSKHVEKLLLKFFTLDKNSNEEQSPDVQFLFMLRCNYAFDRSRKDLIATSFQWKILAMRTLEPRTRPTYKLH